MLYTSFLVPVAVLSERKNMRSDASLIGQGAVCDATTAQGSLIPLDISYSEENINALQRLTVKYGLQSCASIIKNRHIVVHWDNTTAVS